MGSRQRSQSVLSKKSTKSSNQVDLKQSDILAAIILADSFSREFRPITLSRPRSLLPLVNVPVLEYVMEILAASDVQEIYIFCCENSSMIKSYLEKSKWNQNSSAGRLNQIRVQVLTGLDATCAGDAMRAIHDMNIIRSDFVLITGDVISNVDLRPIIQKHKEERGKSKNSPLLMTSVFKEQPSYRINTNLGFNDARHSVWVAIAPDENQLLFYDCDKTSSFKIPMRSFKTYRNIQVRSDLYDCHIDICSPQVLDIFKENFDYQDLRSDFMVNVLTDEIISIDNKVSPYVITDQYASRLSSLRAYELISKDIIKRWMYPVVPDTNFTSDTSYRLFTPNNYFEDNISLERSSKILIDCVIGRGSSVGKNSVLSETTVGRNVVIGNNCKIEGAFLWDNVVVEDNVQISCAIVANGCRIRKGAVIKRGAILGENVVIGEGFVVEERKRLTTLKAESNDSDSSDGFDTYGEDDTKGARLSSSKIDTNEEHVGVGGKGAEYEGSYDYETYNLLGMTDEELELENNKLLEQSLSDERENEDGNIIRGGSESENRLFLSELDGVVKSSIIKNNTEEDSKLEIDSVKFAYNPMPHQHACAIVRSLLQYASKCHPDNNERVSEMFGNLLDGTNSRTAWCNIINTVIAEKSDIQLDILDFLLDYFQNEGSKRSQLISEIVHKLYNADVVDKERILDWADRHGDPNGTTTNDADMRLIKQCEQVIMLLKNEDMVQIRKPKGGWFSKGTGGSDSDSDESSEESESSDDDDDDSDEDSDE